MDLTTLFVAYVGYKVYDALTGDNKKKQSKKYKKSSSSKSSYRRKDMNYRDAPAWFHDHGQNL